jgi:hypothetical protein
METEETERERERERKKERERERERKITYKNFIKCILKGEKTRGRVELY